MAEAERKRVVGLLRDANKHKRTHAYKQSEALCTLVEWSSEKCL